MGGSDVSDISGLQNITSVGGFDMRLTLLTDLDGLQNLETIGGDAYFGENAQLASIIALQNLTTIGGRLTFASNGVLTNLDGLENITGLEGLAINNNVQLQNVNGLQNLTTITGISTIRIANNSNLTNLDGLQNLSAMSGRLFIFQNLQLSDFCGLNTLLNQPSNGGVSPYEVSGNADDPTIMQILDGGACVRVLPVTMPMPEPVEELPAMPLSYLLLFVLVIVGGVVFAIRRMKTA